MTSRGSPAECPSVAAPHPAAPWPGTGGSGGSLPEWVPWEEALSDSSHPSISAVLPLPLLPQAHPLGTRFGAQPPRCTHPTHPEHPKAGGGGQQDLLAPRGVQEGAAGTRRAPPGGPGAAGTGTGWSPSPPASPELPRRLSHAGGAALTACAHSPLASRAVSMPKCHQSPAATSSRPVRASISSKGQGGKRHGQWVTPS